MALYAKMSSTHKHFYIASTVQGVRGREKARYRKAKQLSARKLVSCEIALRYWSQTQTLHDYVTLVLETETTASATRGREAELISKGQPSLNHPFIEYWYKFRHQQGRCLYRPKKSTKVLYARQWSRARKLSRTNWLRQRMPKSVGSAWQLLYQLSGMTLTAFNTAKFLRSHKCSTPRLYCLCRQAQHLDEPGRSRCLPKTTISLRVQELDLSTHFPTLHCHFPESTQLP